MTIFTPTYNRAYTLMRLFESLQNQSCKSFEWLVCNDGSNDNTAELIHQLVGSAIGFDVRYLEQAHGGKHRAQNKAIRYARGRYFITCDSNKFLANDAVENIIKMFATIHNMTDMCGVAGYRADFNGHIFGGKLENNQKFIDCTNLERDKYHLHGDKAAAFYTDILRKYPFPEFDGEDFVSESSWLTPMAMDGFQIRWFPKIIIYGEYTADGLTKRGANEYVGHFSNFEGFLYVLALEIKAYGINKRLPEIYEAIDIANKKGVTDLKLCEKLNLSIIQLRLLKYRRTLGYIKRSIKE